MNLASSVLVFSFVFLFIHPELISSRKTGSKRSQGSTLSKREEFLLQKKLHKLKVLSQKAAKRLADENDYSNFYTKYLQELLHVRVPGTVGHNRVQKFIIKTLNDLGWHVKLDKFEDLTPIGRKNFTNIIATLNPKVDRKLVLAAHYDSKLIKPEYGKYFIGATDSAVPCAMLLDFARLLTEKKKQIERGKIQKDYLNEVSPQLFFLDGEEAFEEWTETDSIYGARNLAYILSKTPHHNASLAYQGLTQIQAIDCFVLFDLLGAKFPQIWNMYQSTTTLYDGLQKIEEKLNILKQLNYPNHNYFPGLPDRPLYIEDDHKPFLKLQVPILHLIPAPFPTVWHTLYDDESALDQDTIEDLLKIFRHFLLEYFHLLH